MEAGAELLFLDEDTSATNFMIRDKVMAKLVSDEKNRLQPYFATYVEFIKRWEFLLSLL